jgi:CRP-like cAMP-binding protein
MDINLILSAQTLTLAPRLRQSELTNGLFVVKNEPAMSYLTVTPEQWFILQQFEKPRMVPAVLGEAIRDRHCLPLAEFYELILKAIRANILLVAGASPKPVEAYPWKWDVRPAVAGRPLMVLFCAGLLGALAYAPRLPSSILDGAVSATLLVAAASFGVFLRGCLVRGGGGEVYQPRWKWAAFPPHFSVATDDEAMLPAQARATIALATPACLAAATGIAAWHKPDWAFFPLVGLIWTLRPALGGRLASMIRAGTARGPSDAEHDYIFPPNRRPEARLKLLLKALSLSTSWARVCYAIVWTFAVLYWVAWLRNVPPWRLAFWRDNGFRIVAGVGLPLVALGAGYAAWEGFLWARERGRARRNTIRLWKTRWFGGRGDELDEAARVKILSSSPLLSMLKPIERLELAQAMTVMRHGPWMSLSPDGSITTHVSVIVSGKISLRRETQGNRSVQVQVLSEGDIIGLHDLADPKFPHYRLRTLTPVKLLTLGRIAAERLIVDRVSQAALTDTLLKLPFLRRISLCQNWHLQAIGRFARLSSIANYTPGDTILSEGRTVEEFFVIFQGEARVSRHGSPLATIGAGEFFGEIGLMQNSSPNASVSAFNGTRCLSIPRTELLRFVTHNYTVALELERVSSQRLGRPLFPLKVGDFRSY